MVLKKVITRSNFRDVQEEINNQLLGMGYRSDSFRWSEENQRFEIHLHGEDMPHDTYFEELISILQSVLKLYFAEGLSVFYYIQAGEGEEQVSSEEFCSGYIAPGSGFHDASPITLGSPLHPESGSHNSTDAGGGEGSGGGDGDSDPVSGLLGLVRGPHSSEA